MFLFATKTIACELRNYVHKYFWFNANIINKCRSEYVEVRQHD